MCQKIETRVLKKARLVQTIVTRVLEVFEVLLGMQRIFKADVMRELKIEPHADGKEMHSEHANPQKG